MIKKKGTRKKAGKHNKSLSQVSQYDKIWRENLKATLPGIIEKVLKIKILSSEALPDKIQITRQKELDLFWKVTDSNKETFALHMEAQVGDDPDMPYRMLEYRVMAAQVYRLPIRQYVIYLGDKPSAMATSIDLPGLKFEYTLISIRDVPYQLFLSSRHPQEKMLSVLGDFGGEDPRQVLRKVVMEVRDASKGDFVGNQRIQQLRILIQLRNLAKEFNTVMETVAKFFREEKDPFFIKGRKEGKLEGKAEGKLESKAEVVRNLLQTGRFTISEIANFTNVEKGFVKKVAATLTSPGNQISGK